MNDKELVDWQCQYLVVCFRYRLCVLFDHAISVVSSQYSLGCLFPVMLKMFPGAIFIQVKI